MALVLSEDKKTLTIVAQDEGPLTRAKLLKDANFCVLVACITGHIKSLKSFGQDKILSNPSVAAQFDAYILEETPETENEAFSIDKWFAEHYKKEEGDTTETDWLDLLMQQELKRKGFCQTLLNCIEMEENMESAQYDRLNRAAFPGAANKSRSSFFTPTSSSSFFSYGGISAPSRPK